jgi:hypothetical protein
MLHISTGEEVHDELVSYFRDHYEPVLRQVPLYLLMSLTTDRKIPVVMMNTRAFIITSTSLFVIEDIKTFRGFPP